jgi:hypothetical protein
MNSASTLKRHGGGTYTPTTISTISPSPTVICANLSAREGAGNE